MSGMVTEEIGIQGRMTLSDLIRFQYFHMLRILWPLILLAVVILPLNLLFFLLGGEWTSIASNMLPISLR